MKEVVYFVLAVNHETFLETIKYNYKDSITKWDYSSNSEIKFKIHSTKYRFIRIHEGTLRKLDGIKGISLILILDREPEDDVMQEQVIIGRSSVSLTKLSYHSGMNIRSLLESAEIMYVPGCKYGEQIKSQKIFGELG